MKKIGFIDYFLNEWHANNYPEWIHEASLELGGEELKVCYAYAELDASPFDGFTTDEWCKKYGVEKCESIEELTEKSDFIIVLSPDNPERHPDLSRIPLMSGKRTYIDKTFAEDADTAAEIFALAKEYGTPVYSSSALRFAAEISEYRSEKKKADSFTVIGPGAKSNYTVHFAEMIRTVMHGDPERLICTEDRDVSSVMFEYADGRTARYMQFHTGYIPFEIIATSGDTAETITVTSEYFKLFIREMTGFFNGLPSPVSGEETIGVMKMLNAIQRSFDNTGRFIRF